MTKRITTTIRGPDDWRDEIQSFADRYGISWTNALILTSKIGRRVLDNVKLNQEQLDRLLDSED